VPPHRLGQLFLKPIHSMLRQTSAPAELFNHAHFTLTNHTIALGDGSRTKFAPEDVSRTRSETRRGRSFRTKWRHFVVAELPLHFSLWVLAEYGAALTHTRTQATRRKQSGGSHLTTSC